MPLRSYSGPGLGEGTGWTCPFCDTLNNSPRGSVCANCGGPEDGPSKEEVAEQQQKRAEQTLDRDVAPTKEPVDVLADNTVYASRAGAGAVTSADGSVRVLRIIEYHGSPAWVTETLTRALDGTFSLKNKAGFITATTLTDADITPSGYFTLDQARRRAAHWLGRQQLEEQKPGETEAPVSAPRPAPSPSPTPAEDAMAKALTEDPRYAATIAEAVEVYYGGETLPSGVHLLTPDEATALVKVLRHLVREATKEPQPV